MRIIITHIKNEEYLLNWWLPHHKEKFDHGIIIDYGSTDRSIELIKKITPSWQIVPSRNKDFNALNCDLEVMDIERSIQNQYPGTWVMALNATEFLVGNTKRLFRLNPRDAIKIQKLISCDTMIDIEDDIGVEPDPNVSLIQQRFHGIEQPYDETNKYNYNNSALSIQAKKDNVICDHRRMRSLHNCFMNYIERVGTGRHFWGDPCNDFLVLNYGFSPWTTNLINRKLAIQDSIPQSDKDCGNGIQHIVNTQQLQQRFDWSKKYRSNLKDKIDRIESMPN